MDQNSVRVWIMLIALAFTGWAQGDESLWLELPGKDGPGKGKTVVLIAGDEEYRSEEALPMLGQVLSERCGFHCFVLFSIDEQGHVAPETRDNTPGLAALEKADLMVIATRFRELPPNQMQSVIDYLKQGKPVIGLRTATHAFLFPSGHAFEKWTHDSSDPNFEGGFGRQILGERWVAHHGNHGSESTRGRIVDSEHPIVHGIPDEKIWGPTDVYAVRLPLPDDCHVIVEGEVLDGMTPDASPVEGTKNNPRMPIAWTKSYKVDGGPEGRVFTTTMGASQDFQSPELRRLLVNACLWCLGMEAKISAELDVNPVGNYHPTPFGFGKYQKGRTPLDFLPK